MTSLMTASYAIALLPHHQRAGTHHRKVATGLRLLRERVRLQLIAKKEGAVTLPNFFKIQV